LEVLQLFLQRAGIGQRLGDPKLASVQSCIDSADQDALCDVPAVATLVRCFRSRRDGHPIRTEASSVENIADGAAYACFVNDECATVIERRPGENIRDVWTLVWPKN
jgi:hypothetical protein